MICMLKERLLQHKFHWWTYHYADKQNPLEPSDEHHKNIKEVQDIVEAEYALHAKSGDSLQNSAVEIKNATMPDTESKLQMHL